MQNATRGKRIVLIILIIVLGFSILGHIKQCAAFAETEEDWPYIPEPDPSYGWDDYTDDHPLFTPEPTTEPPTPEPTRGPILRATNIYNRARLRMYKYYVEPQVPPPGIHKYQMLSSPWTSSTSPTSFAAVDSVVINDSMREFSSALRAGSQPSLNPSTSNCGNINLVDSYIVFEWEMRYTASTDVTVGSGLNYGLQTMFGFTYNVNVFDHVTGSVILDIPCSTFYTVTFDDNTVFKYSVPSETCSSIQDLKRGFGVLVRSDLPGKKVSKIVFKVCIGLGPDSLDYSIISQQNRSVLSVDVVSVTSNGANTPFTVGCVTVPMQPDQNMFMETLNNLPNVFAGLIVPTQDQVARWIANHQPSTDDNPTMLSWSVFLQMLQSILDGNNVDPFVLKIPSLKINIGGANYTYFNGIQYDISEADILIPGTNHTLFYYTRLVGDCVIVAAFISNYLYKLWKRLFDVNYASGMEDLMR